MDPRRARVLVVDDEPALGRVIARILALEHDTVVMTSAVEALASIAAGEDFDLILCDLLMPGVDGVELYQRVGTMAPALVDRIVVMTGGAFTERTVAFLDRSCIRRLDKPFEPEQLRRLVRERVVSVKRNHDPGFTSVRGGRRCAGGP